MIPTPTPTPRTVRRRNPPRKKSNSGTFYGQSPFSFPLHEVSDNFPLCPSLPLSPSFYSLSSACTSTCLNPLQCRPNAVTSRHHLFRLPLHRLPSKQPFSVNDWVNPTLDGRAFLLTNGAPAERVHSLSDDGLTLGMKSSHNLVSSFFVLYHRAMRTFHAVLDIVA